MTNLEIFKMCRDKVEEYLNYANKIQKECNNYRYGTDEYNHLNNEYWETIGRIRAYREMADTFYTLAITEDK